MKVSVCEIYIRVNHTWKKVGILATGCRRYGAKSNAKWQKTTICRTQPEIKGELRLVRKDNFLVAVVFEIFFQVWCEYIYYDYYQNVNNKMSQNFP